MRLRRSLSIIGLVFAILLAAGVTYLFTADLGRHRQWIESIISNRIGRTLSIEGEFHLRLGSVIRLSAGHIRLANAPWGKTADMLDADQLTLQVNLWSLFHRPIRIRSLSIGTARIDLERNKQNQANWVLRRKKKKLTLPVFVEHADAHQVAVTLRDPKIRRPVHIQLDSVRIAENQQNLLNLSMNTRLGAYNGTLTGTLGPVPALRTGQHLTFNLKGDSDLGNFALKGGIASLKDLERPDIKLTAFGPRVETITSLFNLPTVAQGPFNVTGSATGQSGNIDLKLVADVGNLDAEAQLHASDLKQSPVFNLVTHVHGPNLGGTATLLGVKNLPQQSFTLSGRVRHDQSGPLLEKIQLQTESIHALIDGRLGNAPGYHDTFLTVKAHGPDLSAFGPAIGLKQMHAANFYFTGYIGHTNNGFMLEAARLNVANNILTATGRLGTLPGLEGADLSFFLSAPDLASLGAIAGISKLPKLPVKGGGRITQSGGVVALDSLNLDLGVGVVSSHGTLIQKRKGGNPKLSFTVIGMDLSRLGEKLGIRQFPAQPFKATFQTSFSSKTVALQDVDAIVGSARLTGDGVLNRPRFLHDARFEFRAHGSDLGMLLRNIKKAPTPRIPFKLQANLATSGARISVRKLAATFSGAQFSAQGTLGKPPQLSDTNLEFKVSGKSLASALKPFGITEYVPDKLFEISGHATGSLKRVLASVQTRVGDNHGRGDITLVPGKPDRLTVRLDTDVLDLTPLLAKAGEPTTKPKSGSSDNKLVIPNTPLAIKWPEDLQASADIKIGQFRFKKLRVDSLNVEGKLTPDKLDIQSVKGLLHGGPVNGSLLLQRRDHGVQAKLSLKATDTRTVFQFTPSDIPIRELPPTDANITLSGHGRSLHDLAATANGRIQLVYGSGLIASRTGAGILTSDLLTQIVNTLNPFDKREPYAKFQCGLLAADVKNGVLSTDSVLLQTDKLLTTSKGHLNLHDESLDFIVSAKPRKGLGLSAAGLVEHYIKVGGTLSHWNLALDPKGLAIAGGAAAATGGWSVLLEALWGRITSGGNVCEKELKKRGLTLPGSQ